MEMAAAVDEARMIACTSRAADPQAAVAELAECISGRKLAGALLFCSNAYPRDALQAALAEAMPDALIDEFDARSRGEIVLPMAPVAEEAPGLAPAPKIESANSAGTTVSKRLSQTSSGNFARSLILV